VVNKASGAQDRLGELAEKHELSSGDADRARGYIDACTKSGFTPIQIKTAMLQAGWSTEDVESLLAKNPNIKSDLSEAREKAAKLGEADLKPYISDQLNSGFTPEQIKLALKKAGWKDDEVERAFAG
jgi:SOS response regulatory protein OraA/RecX